MDQFAALFEVRSVLLNACINIMTRILRVLYKYKFAERVLKYYYTFLEIQTILGVLNAEKSWFGVPV